MAKVIPCVRQENTDRLSLWNEEDATAVREFQAGPGQRRQLLQPHTPRPFQRSAFFACEPFLRKVRFSLTRWVVVVTTSFEAVVPSRFLGRVRLARFHHSMPIASETDWLGDQHVSPPKLIAYQLADVFGLGKLLLEIEHGASIRGLRTRRNGAAIDGADMCFLWTPAPASGTCGVCVL